VYLLSITYTLEVQGGKIVWQRHCQ